MDLVYKISKQTFWQVLAKFITSISTIIILTLITRKFGPEGTGIYTLAITYISFFYLATDLGLNAHFLPELHSENSQSVFQKLLGIRLIVAAILIILALIITPLLPFNKQWFLPSVLIGIWTVIPYAIYLTTLAKFQSNLKYKYYFLIVFISTAVSFLAIFLFTYFNFPIPYLFLANLLGWIVCSYAAILLVRKYYAKIFPIFNWKFLKTTIWLVWPISATLLINMVYFRADSMILSVEKGFSDVGIYNLAYQVFQSALVIPTYITNAYYPLMLVDLRQNKIRFLANLKKILLIMIGLSILGIISTYILSPVLINLISGGKGFAGSIQALQILALGFPAFFLSSVLFWLLISLKRYYLALWIYFIGLLINVLLNLIFIPQYSYIASSYITGISEYLILILQLIILIKIFPYEKIYLKQ